MNNPMNNLTLSDLKNLLALTGKASIIGNEAMTVAILQQKISQEIKRLEESPVEAVKPDKAEGDKKPRTN